MSKRGVDIQNFLTRADKLKMMTHIPISTQNRIIVKSNNEGIGFRFDSYVKEFLHPHLTKETFDATVRGAHKICETVWSIRKQEEERVYNVKAKRIFMLSIFMLFVSLIFMIVKVYGDITLGNWLVYVSLILMIFSGATTLALIILSMLTKPQFTDFESTIIKKLEQYFSKENVAYAKRGMEWKVGEKFYWIELHIFERNELRKSTTLLDERRETELRKAKTNSLIRTKTLRSPTSHSQGGSPESRARRENLNREEFD